MADHGGGKKKSRIPGCLTNIIVVAILIYIGVFVIATLVPAFLQNKGKSFIALSGGATTANPTAVPAKPQDKPQAATPTPTQMGYIAPGTNGSTSTGGGTNVAYQPGTTAPSKISVNHSGFYYVVGRGDLYAGGNRLTFDQSLSLIAAKLLTTSSAMKALNSELVSGSLTEGQVLRVPNEIDTGGGLPPTGRYAQP